MGKEEIIGLLRKHFEALSIEFGVSRIALFGSVANDTMKQDSDVDLLIEFTHPIGFRFNQLADDIEGFLGMKVDILTRDGIRNIRVEAIAANIEESLIYV